MTGQTRCSGLSGSLWARGVLRIHLSKALRQSGRASRSKSASERDRAYPFAVHRTSAGLEDHHVPATFLLNPAHKQVK